MDFLLHHTIRQSASRFPDKEALVDGDQRLTYSEVALRVASLAEGLRDAGLRRGERVGIFLEPSVPQALSIYATSQADGVFVPIHHGLFPDQVAHIVNDCEMTALVTDASRLESLNEILPQLPCLRFIIVVGDKPPITDADMLEFDSLCGGTPPQAASEISVEKDLAAILYTSGSTGRPKGVMLSHSNLIAGASIVSSYLGITDRDRILAVLPFSFDAGLNQLTTAFQQGATMVLTRFLFANDIVRKLEHEHITGLAGVPSLWALLAQPSARLQQATAPDLRYITNTGGVMQQKVLSKLREALPATEVFLMYGLTEAFRSTYLPPAELDRRPESMGKAIPNTEILVINDEGELCQPGEVGELVHHGPTVSMGYWGHEELTQKVLRPHPFPPAGVTEPCKVVYSGDLVKMDKDGFLYFVARADNQIKTSGFRVSPTEVEEILCKFGDLQEVAVIGIPDEVLGHRIKAFIVASEGSSLDPDELLATCAEAMPRHMIPKSIEVVDSLPKTSSGKVDYPSLRQNNWKRSA